MTADTLFLYRIQITRPAILTAGPTAEESAIMTAHAEHLERLASQGVVLLAGRTLNTDPTCFGIVVFAAADLPAARAIMEGDPGVRAGLWHAELFPFRIAYRGGALRGA
jgi:uncharacterized protein YciI